MMKNFFIIIQAFLLVLFPFFSQKALAVETANPVTDHLYTGQIKDDTGLYYYNARYYDPQLGIFTSADRAQGPNRYAYVGGNPIMRNDPSGNEIPDDNFWNKFWQNTYEKNRDLIDPLVDLGKTWYSGFQDLSWYEKPAVALGVPIMIAGAVGINKWASNPQLASDWAVGNIRMGSSAETFFRSFERTKAMLGIELLPSDVYEKNFGKRSDGISIGGKTYIKDTGNYKEMLGALTHEVCHLCQGDDPFRLPATVGVDNLVKESEAYLLDGNTFYSNRFHRYYDYSKVDPGYTIAFTPDEPVDAIVRRYSMFYNRIGQSFGATDALNIEQDYQFEMWLRTSNGLRN